MKLRYFYIGVFFINYFKINKKKFVGIKININFTKQIKNQTK